VADVRITVVEDRICCSEGGRMRSTYWRRINSTVVEKDGINVARTMESL
jgi:hypothetical protein